MSLGIIKTELFYYTLYVQYLEISQLISWLPQFLLFFHVQILLPVNSPHCNSFIQLRGHIRTDTDRYDLDTGTTLFNVIEVILE